MGGKHVVVALAAGLALLAPSSAGAQATPPAAIDFSEEAEATEVVTVAPRQDLERASLMPNKYQRHPDRSGQVEGIEDPLPLTPQRRGCGACSTSSAATQLADVLLVGAVLAAGWRPRRRV